MAACPTPDITLPTELAARVESAGDPFGLEPSYGCELPAGHDGPHYALGQGFPDLMDIWIQWRTGQAPELLTLPACESQAGDDPDHPDDGTPCTQFDGHPGPHSYTNVSSYQMIDRDSLAKLADALAAIDADAARAHGLEMRLQTQMQFTSDVDWVEQRMPGRPSELIGLSGADVTPALDALADGDRQQAGKALADSFFIAYWKGVAEPVFGVKIEGVELRTDEW